MFQSTRPHGARHINGGELVELDEFQSTRPHGARHDIQLLLQEWREVSIHAPTRGATYTHVRFRRGYTFQSTRPHGARRARRKKRTAVEMFQSTRPHGARLMHVEEISWRPRGFNPRAHTGRDSIFCKRLNICIQNYTFCETWQTYTQNCFY